MVSPAKPGEASTELSSLESRVKDYVGIEKLSNLINRSYPATLRMVRADKIHGTRHGNEWQIKLSEVRRFLEQGNNPNPQPHT